MSPGDSCIADDTRLMVFVFWCSSGMAYVGLVEQGVAVSIRAHHCAVGHSRTQQGTGDETGQNRAWRLVDLLLLILFIDFC